MMETNVKYPKLLKAIIRHCGDSSEGLAILDANQPLYPVLDINDLFTEITGYQRDEIIGQSLKILDGPETNSNTTKKILQGFKSQTIVNTDIINYRKNGSRFWNKLSMMPIKNSGQLNYWVAIIRDVSPITSEVRKATELNTMETMVHSISDIVFNYLNYLQLFRISLEEEENINPQLLKEFDENYKEFFKDVKHLSDVEHFNELLLSKGIKILNI